ncbi:MAG: tripartite tricarboxylate transporter substrate binding protein [Betaproteobacteria bacterium]|nr:tripartite tricarboxylate transporter substrate binding protein [Betaproteobacteria bacterium]MBV9362581.1 tripartite tricarboxylate transporter substrate binding protein [Betaproteobacteria bacterium]
MRAVLAIALFAAASAFAQSWPAKPVRMIVTFAPGGSSDIVARLVAIPLQAELGQTIIVDNKPGAGGTIGALEAAHAAPDGYTLLLSNSAPISISPAMQDEPRYDPVKSFTHVTYIGSVANVFVVHPSIPAKTMAELIAWIKAEPNPVNYGSGGIGSIGHIVGETMKKEHGLRMEHIGYKGSSPMHNDLIPGTIKLAIDTLPQNVPLIKDGRLRAIAVTSPARAQIAPEVPSVLEAGEKNLVAENFLGVSGPAGLPNEVVVRLHAATRKSLADPKVTQRLSELGVQGKEMTPNEFTAFVANQVREWHKPVKDSGAKLN